jgi:succinyl-diaminopimelate desuccinylase
MTTKELIAQTKRLIAIPSTADNPPALRQAVDFVAGIVAAHPNITIERFERGGRPSFLAYRGPKRPAKFEILLNAHVDVVPGKPELFKPYEKDGKLYGRGALDMKGTALALTNVFCELVNEVPYALGLQIVSDEEVGGYDGVCLQMEKGVQANFVMIGEYANHPGTIYNAARGLAWVELAFKGKGGHGAHPWNGANAVVKASDFASAVLQRYPTPTKETWATTASIASLSTPNDTYNKVPDTAVLKVDFRFTQEDPVFRTKESLQAFVASIDPDAKILSIPTFEPALYTDELHPNVQGLKQALEQVRKNPANFLGRPGGSDGRHFAATHMPAIEFGLYGHGSHGDSECVELDSFAEYQTILRQFLRQPRPVGNTAPAKPAEPLQLTLLRQLVAMPTVTQDTAANNRALAFIQHFVEERGMHTSMFESQGFRSLLATTRPGNKRPTILLTAHCDVVPGKEAQFTLTEKQGKLYGRGVMDMKFAIASYLWLIDELKDQLDHYDLGLLITSDEEVGSPNGASQLAGKGKLLPKVAIVPDGGENWQPETFAKGALWIKLEALGKRAHASRPWEGKSAITALLSCLADIKKLAPSDPHPEDTLISVGTIEGGHAANQIPVAASAMLDIRTGKHEAFEELFPKIEAISRNHDITATLLISAPPCVNDLENPYIKPFCDLLQQTTGRPVKSSFSFAASDARFFSAAGVPCIIIEPPAGGRHADNEWLSTKGYYQFCDILKQYVQQVGRRQPTVRKLRQQNIAQLANRLNSENRPAQIWYASYGSGLSKENFLMQIRGGNPEGSKRVYAGCTNQAPPQKDVFMLLPHRLYFAGQCEAWGGGHINIEIEPSPDASTIARAYLITIDQFEEIVAQQNKRRISQPLPLKDAMQRGHATIGEGQGYYDELVCCGMKDGRPIFTLTAVRPELPYVPPTLIYARLLCKGLAENTDMDHQAVITYMLSMPGIAGHYKKQELRKLFQGLVPKN